MAQECSLACVSACEDGMYNDYVMHLELGAANYGPDGHTKTSQDKTVFHEFREVTAKPNYRDRLNDVENIEYLPMFQYNALCHTIDEFVKSNSGRVVLFINDLFAEYVDDAVAKVKDYLSIMQGLHGKSRLGRGYANVVVEPIIGNYTEVNMTAPLAKYGRAAYDSVHLKNPEVSFYNYGIDGDDMLHDDESRAKAREKLRMLANFSCDGLFFFPVDARNSFIPKVEYQEYIDRGVFYAKTVKWQPVPYVFPEGGAFPRKYSAVYYIRSNTTDEKCKKL